MKEQDLLKLKASASSHERGTRTRRLNFSSPIIIEYEGLKPIKQVELFTKWRPMIPEEFRDEICPRPSDDVYDLVKTEKAAKLSKVAVKEAKKNKK